MPRGWTENPLGINEHARIFERVFVTPSFTDTTVVSWQLDARYTSFDQPYAFYIEWAPHINADFEEVAGPTTSNVLYDDEPRRLSKAPQSVYRVRLDVAGNSYYSDPDDGMGQWNRHDYLLAREIIRREYLLAQSYAGVAGQLLAQRHFGHACTRCIDFNTDEPTDGDCELCFGTGFLGGYYPPSLLYVIPQPKTHRESQDATRGTVADRVMTARIVAHPTLVSRDVWVNPETAERWVIQTKQEVTAIRGKVLIWNVELRLLELSSIIYRVSTNAGLSSSV